MSQKLTMVYWESDGFLLGKLLEHPEIMTQGETVEELEENLREAFRLMAACNAASDRYPAARLFVASARDSPVR